MSANKKKYFTVTKTYIVSANNKGDALAKTERKRGVDAQVLDSFESIERISAAEAKGQLTMEA